MSDIKNSKSLLAKLLASENITVSHQNTPTAYFDLKTRSLVCPVWKDMDGDLYDLLMGHEVGHALETPEQGWHNAVKDGDVKFKGFLNVIEDARIERKIKSRFPGLGRSFSAAYKSLWERDFFGIKNVDIGELTLIDRINIRFKLGAHVHVPFNDEERAMIAEVETTETWEDVEALARRVYGYSKEHEQDKIQSMDDLKSALKNLANEESSDEDGEEESEEYSDTQSDSSDFGDDFGDDYDDYDDEDGEEDSSSSGDGEENDSDGAGTDSDEEAEETADGNSKHLGGLNDGEEKAESNDLESVTDTNFRQRESELVNEGGIISMFELPEADLSKIIVNNNIVMNDLESWLREQTQNSDIYRNAGISYDKVVEKCVRKFTRNNNKFVMHLVKEFEMRKKASQYARQQSAKTGELDMNVLHKYKFSSDLFKKVTVVPRGKNHGMILFLDMSGSMSNILRNTLEQLLVLVSFCKTVRIPFDVYGFSDDLYSSLDRQTSVNIASSNHKKFSDGPNVCRVMGHSFHLKHLIGSSLSPTAMRRAFNSLCVVVNEYSASYKPIKDCGYFERNWDKSGFGLNGTPFVHTLLASREIIKNFRAAHKLDVTNVVYLTDGEGGDGLSCPDGTGMYSSYYGKKLGVVYLIDKKTKKKVRIDDNWNQQAAVTNLVRDVTGCKHIGFYLMESRSLRYVMRDMSSKFDAVKRSALLKQMREEKFFAIPNLGYDNYFYIEAAEENITEEGIGDLTGMTKAKITSAFKKSMNSKKSSRALVSQFAKEIAAGGLVA